MTRKTTIEDWISDWENDVYDELDELEEYALEGNLLMVKACLGLLRDFLDEFDKQMEVELL